jgi:hypothetical protein
MSIANVDDDVSQCRTRVAGYHLAIDRGQATPGIDAFTDDAVFEIRGEQLQGRGEILDFLTRREALADRQTVHLIGNERVVDRGVDELVLGCLVLLHLRRADGSNELEPGDVLMTGTPAGVGHPKGALSAIRVGGADHHRGDRHPGQPLRLTPPPPGVFGPGLPHSGETGSVRRCARAEPRTDSRRNRMS